MAMAVALHLRGDGVISAESATWIWQLTDLHPESVHATLVGRSTSPLPGVSLHRVPTMHADDVRWRNGIPVSSPTRAVADFAASGASPARVESAVAILRRGRLATDAQIRSTLDRLPDNHGGVRLIRELLEVPPGELVLTRSIYERRLRRLLAQAGLPMPVSNLVVAGRERDCVWPQAKLILEFDGFDTHRDTFRSDRARDSAAAALGWRVMRITADRIDSAPYALIAEIAAALAVSLA